MSSLEEQFQQALDNEEDKDPTSPDYVRPGQLSPVKIEEDVLRASDQIKYDLDLAQKQTKVDEGKTSAWLKSMGVEMGIGMSGTLAAHKYLGGLKWVNRGTKVNPAFWSNPVGWATIVGGEGLSWLGANLVGQEVRKYYGIQLDSEGNQTDETHASELFASFAFGISPVTRLVEGRKIFQFAQPAVGDAFTSKARTVILNGVKTTVSGATLGLAESIFRQEMAVMMNEIKNRNEYDYLTSTVAGAGMNLTIKGVGSLWSLWRKSGAWGRSQATEATNRVVANVESQKADIQAQMAELNKRASTKGNPRANAANARRRHDLKKKLDRLEQVKQMSEEALEEIEVGNKIIEDREANPQPLKDVVEEPEVTAPKASEPEIPKTLKELKTNFIDNKRPVPAREGEFPYIDTPEGYFKQGDVYRHKDDPDFKVEETDAEGVVRLAEDIANEAGGDGVYQLRRHMGPLSNPEDASKALREKAEELAPVQQAQRDLLRQKYGDTVTVYRVEDPDFTASPDRDVSSWSLEKKSVEERLLVEGTVLKEKTISVDDVQFVYNHKETEVLLKDDVVDAPKAEEPTVEEPAPKTPEEPTVDLPEHESKLEELKKRLRGMKPQEEGSIELPNIGLESNKLYNEQFRKLHGLLEGDYLKSIKGGKKGQGIGDTNVIEDALDVVRFIRKLNDQVRDPVRAMAGRGTQSQKEIASADWWKTKKSNEALLQDDAWSKLERGLRESLEEADGIELDNLYKQVLDVSPNLRKQGKDIHKQAVKDHKRRNIEEEATKDPKRVEKLEAKEKVRLQKRLKKLQDRFGDDSKLTLQQQAKKQESSEEVADLKARIRFHEANERDAIKLGERLKERDRLLKIETGRLGAQRDETSPKPKGPKKTPGKLEKVNADITFLRKNMRDRVREIDQARRDIEEAKTAAQLHDEEISKLDKELEQLRKEFGDDSALVKDDVEGAPKKEKHPDILAKEAQIKFHKEARQEAITLDQKIAERNRLLALETGPLGAQRAEVTKSTKTDNKAPGRIEKLNEDIAFLRKNMRDRVREIDKARLEMTPEFQAEKAAKMHQRKIARLEKELTEARERFGDMDAVEARAEAAANKPKPEKHPVIAEKEAQLKWHREAEKEALLLAKLEKEFADTVEMEAREVVGEMRAATDPKPKGPTKPKASDELRKKITDSKARMRAKVRDITKAKQKEIEDRISARILASAEQAMYDIAKKNHKMGVDTVMENWLVARQLSLINQIPSALAGTITGVVGVGKQFVRPTAAWTNDLMDIVGNFLKRDTTSGMTFDRANLNFKIEMAAAFKMFEFFQKSRAKELFTSMARTARDFESATGGTGGRGRMIDDVDVSKPLGSHRKLKEARRRVESRIKTESQWKNFVAKSLPIGNWAMWALSLGGRGIQGVDDGFRRPLIHSNLWAEALQEAAQNPANKGDWDATKKQAQVLFDSYWTESDGLRVLSVLGERAMAVDKTNRQLLFMANVTDRDPSEIALPLAETFVKARNIVIAPPDHPSVGWSIRTLVPYFGVIMRGFGMMGRAAAAPITVGGSTAVQKYRNPYKRKMKNVETDLAGLTSKANDVEASASDKADAEEAIKGLQEKLKILDERRIEYNRDAYADAALGATFFAYAMTSNETQGTNAWMTEDQRKAHEGVQGEPGYKPPQTVFGISVRDWIPINLALVVGADVRTWLSYKAEEARTGQEILSDDQDLFDVIKSSLVASFKDMPANQGAKMVEDVLTGTKEIRIRALTGLANSFNLFPSQIKKTSKFLQSDGKIIDLRGGSFLDRAYYEAFGNGPKNYKTDDFGEDMQSTRTVGQQITRLAPGEIAEGDEFTDIRNKDVYGDLMEKPTFLMPGVNMTQFKNDDGITLLYAFNKKLRQTNLKQEVYEEINTQEFQDYVDEGPVDSDTYGKLTNPGIASLNQFFKDYHTEVKDDIIDDVEFQRSFVTTDENEEGSPEFEKYGRYVTLEQLINHKDEVSGEPSGVAPSILNQLTR